MNGTLDIVDRTMWVTKCYRLGVQDNKAKPVRVEFSMSSGSSGEMEAWALTSSGGVVLPKLQNAEMTGWYADGFRLRGYCYETLAGSSRKMYCEWYVRHGVVR